MEYMRKVNDHFDNQRIEAFAEAYLLDTVLLQIQLWQAGQR